MNRIRIGKAIPNIINQAGPQSGTKSGTKSSSSNQVSDQVSDQVIKMLEICEHTLALNQIGKAIGVHSRIYLKRKYINPLLDAGLLEMTIPEKPTSSQQKYRTTEKGIQLLHEKQEGQHA